MYSDEHTPFNLGLLVRRCCAGAALALMVALLLIMASCRQLPVSDSINYADWKRCANAGDWNESDPYCHAVAEGYRS